MLGYSLPQGYAMLWQLALIVLLIALNGFFAAAEMALISVNRIRLRRLAEEGDRRAKLVMRLIQHPGQFLATIQIGITLTGFFASAVGAVSIASFLSDAFKLSSVPFLVASAETLSVAIVTVIIAFLTLILGELTPKNLAVRNAEGAALAVAYPISLLGRIAAPAVWFLNNTTNLLLGGTAQVKLPSVTQDEIVTAAEVASEEGSIDDRERQIVQGAFQLGEKRIGELVVPRVDVKALPIDADLKEAQILVIQTGHSRIPIYRQTIDEIVGVLHTKDLLAALPFDANAARHSVAEILRPTIYVPESVHADEVLRRMQRQRVHLAVVVDEYGGTAGIVTLENLLEELVGPIRDEYDAAEQPEIKKVSDEEVIASGDADIDDVCEALGIKLDDVEVDTVGGLVYSELGRIPLAGDVISHTIFEAEVLKMTGNRVALVRLRRIASSMEE